MTMQRAVSFCEQRIYYSHIDDFIKKELVLNGIAGPYNISPYWCPIISPLMTAHKKPDSRRICFDLTFGDNSVNNNTPKGEFLGDPYIYNYPKADQFEQLILKHGKGSLMWKCDLSRFLMQLPVLPIHLIIKPCVSSGRINFISM